MNWSMVDWWSGTWASNRAGWEASYSRGLPDSARRIRLGWALQSDSGYQCFPHQPSLVRRPDVSFVKAGRFPRGMLPKGWSRIAPDLAIEVVSPNDTVYDLEEKLEDYRQRQGAAGLGDQPRLAHGDGLPP